MSKKSKKSVGERMIAGAKEAQEIARNGGEQASGSLMEAIEETNADLAATSIDDFDAVRSGGGSPGIGSVHSASDQSGPALVMTQVGRNSDMTLGERRAQSGLDGRRIGGMLNKPSPAVGRIVHFSQEGSNVKNAAIITEVLGEDTVHLTVFVPGTGGVPGLAVQQGEREDLSRRRWYWPQY